MAILDVFVMIFGKIPVETPKYETIKTTDEYEIRNYPPRVVAQVTYDQSEVKDKDGYGFDILANYIGAFGNPKNVKNTAPEQIAMTAPVITKETIAMTAPVVTKEGEGKTMTMEFMLPEKYKSVEEAPKPLDERVQLREQGEMKYGVVKFSGLVRSLKDKAVAEKTEKLRKCLERDGFRVIGDPILARYNPPWTLPFFRTNEIFMPVE